MRFLWLLIYVILVNGELTSQSQTALLQPGDQAPSFIMNARENTIQSITFPHEKKIVLVHFWSSNVKRTRIICKHLDRMAQKYANASYRNAEGFEVIAIAVQTDRNSWNEAIKADSLKQLTHGIAIRGYNDEVCKKFNVTNIPASFLIDEDGKILAVNPGLTALENVLDERKNFKPLKKDFSGVLAQSSNPKDVLKFSRIFLFNSYGDSIGKTTTSGNGGFLFSEMKMHTDYLLKVDNKIDINTTDPIALYTWNGEFMMDGQTKDEGFVFFINSRNNGKLIRADSLAISSNSLGEISVTKFLAFNSDGTALTPKDEQELAPLLMRLQKNKTLNLEIVTHTDARIQSQQALDITIKQAATIQKHFQKKGIAPSRIQTVAKGNSELRKRCDGIIDCREEDHRLNRRVELFLYKED